MSKKKSPNPFPVNQYQGANLFCDRKEETHALVSSLQNGTSTVLHAPRRYGKTGLIQHVFAQLGQEKNTLCIFMDVFSARNLEDFNNIFLEALSAKLAEQDSNFLNKIGSIFKNLRPVISFDAVSGMPKVSVGVGDVRQQQKSLSEIFKILRQRKEHIFIAIDEFQQILNFEDHNPEALLRTEIQHSTNLGFIFSGSQRQLLLPMFSDASRPFFSSTGFLQLEKIDRQTYHDFILKKFTEAGRQISGHQVEKILDWCDGHTYYVQVVCNRLFASTGKTPSDQDLQQVFEGILREQDAILTSLHLMLKSSPNQWNLYKAISLEGKVSSPTGRDFIQKHKLASSAAVVGALKALEEKELIYVSGTTEEGKPVYQNYNPFFGNWFKYR